MICLRGTEVIERKPEKLVFFLANHRAEFQNGKRPKSSMLKHNYTRKKSLMAKQSIQNVVWKSNSRCDMLMALMFRLSY
jgi:hypothetical protein